MYTLYTSTINTSNVFFQQPFTNDFTMQCVYIVVCLYVHAGYQQRMCECMCVELGILTDILKQ